MLLEALATSSGSTPASALLTPNEYIGAGCLVEDPPEGFVDEQLGEMSQPDPAAVGAQNTQRTAGQVEEENRSPGFNPEAISDNNMKSLRRKVIALATNVGAGFSFAAALSNVFCKEDHWLAKSMNYLGKKVIGLVYGLFGSVSGYDAWMRKDLKQFVPQMLAIIVPNFLTKDPDNLTLFRGPEVGIAGAAAEAEKLHGTTRYASHMDSLRVLHKGLVDSARAFFKNPAKAMVDFNSGIGGIIANLVTAISPIPLFTMGSRKFAYVLRQWGGLTSEGGRLAWDNIRKGRFAHFLSGIMFTASSVVHLLSGFVRDSYRRPLENLTWVFSMLAKNAQIEAFNSGELSNQQEFDYQAGEVPQLLINKTLSLFGLGRWGSKITPRPAREPEPNLFPSMA